MFPVVAKRISIKLVGPTVTSINSLENVSVVGPWKHLYDDQVVQLLQLNRALWQLSGLPIKVIPGLGEGHRCFL